MSLHSFASKEYLEKRVKFHPLSFKISGISHYQNIATQIEYSSKIIMTNDYGNKYDKNAIRLDYNDKLIGYVPTYMIDKIQLCIDQGITDLKPICIKRINDVIGIRVIPMNCYEKSMIDESIFGD